MMKKFNDIVNDPDLISMRSLMALNGVRLSELLSRLPEGESKAVLGNLRTLMDHQRSVLSALGLSPGLSEEHRKKLSEVVEELDAGLTMCEEAAKTSAVWEEIATVVEGHRKLSDTERRREEALQQSITMPQAIALFNGLFALISKIVKQEDERMALADGLRKLLEHKAEPAEIVA